MPQTRILAIGFAAMILIGTLFGQLVILGLIQVGGLGFITIGVYIAVLFKKRIGLSQREAIHESVNTMEVAGVCAQKSSAAGTGSGRENCSRVGWDREWQFRKHQ